MPGSYEVWFHPLSGLVVLLAVVLVRGRLPARADSEKGAKLRWTLGASLVSLLFLQLLSVLRAIFATEQLDELPYDFFGIACLFLALLLFLLGVRGSLPASRHS